MLWHTKDVTLLTIGVHRLRFDPSELRHSDTIMAEHNKGGKMKLFRDYELRTVIDDRMAKLSARIEQYSNDEIMANDLEILAENCYEEFRFEPVVILTEEFSKRELNQQKISKRIEPYLRDFYQKETVEVDGLTVKFYYPYTGDILLFSCRATSFSLGGYPNIDLEKSHAIFTYKKSLSELKTEEDKDKLLAEHTRELQEVQNGIRSANNDVSKFNASLRPTALKMLTGRKNKVEQFFTLSKLLEVPLVKTDFAVTHIPMQRKILPIAKKYNNEQSYCINDDEYEYILEIIKHNGSTYERTPKSYKAMKEEDLRSTLLASLNGMYKGGASGEAFRNKGKTDICIEKDNRAAFVAECKMWNGAASIPLAIEQLEGYLTWRDCKTALIYFVRNRDFFNVIQTASQTLSSLPSMRQVKEIDKNEFDCCALSTANEGQILRIRVMFFNLYCQ